MKKDYKKHIAVLRAAKRRLVAGQDRLICFAIEHTSGSAEVHKYLRDWIDRDLKGCPTYAYWVYKNYPTMHRKVISSDLKEGRLQWIDSMIKELQRP